MNLARVGTQETPAHTSPITRDPRLESSAHEFEASLMAELLKPLQEKDGLMGEDSDTGGAGSGGALSGFASESLARAISERGGFGIASRILHRFDQPAQSGSQSIAKQALAAHLKFSG